MSDMQKLLINDLLLLSFGTIIFAKKYDKPAEDKKILDRFIERDKMYVPKKSRKAL